MLCPDWKLPKSGRLGRLPALGVPEGPYLNLASRESLIAFERQLKILADRGYVIKHIRAFDEIAEIAERHHRMIAGEMARAHKKWFSLYESRYRPQTAALIREGQKVSVQEIKLARSLGQKLRVELEVIMAKHKIDLWASPAATGPAPKGLSSTGDPAMNLPWTYAGLPAVTVPTYHGARQLPLGLQLVAPFMADERLLLWAEPIADVVK
jgi:Asp-tRNA(Asn)/Glu-tRNA(Gln) amidotransferase A subunit family amidase